MIRIALALCVIAGPALAQELHHPAADMPLHTEHYRFWKDSNGSSCCSNKDCYPTKARWRNGLWYALRREDQHWVRVPTNKIISQVSPDGRAHLCSHAPSGYVPNPIPLCFVPPEGGV